MMLNKQKTPREVSGMDLTFSTSLKLVPEGESSSYLKCVYLKISYLRSEIFFWRFKSIFHVYNSLQKKFGSNLIIITCIMQVVYTLYVG